jgi:hypothetical protein
MSLCILLRVFTSRDGNVIELYIFLLYFFEVNYNLNEAFAIKIKIKIGVMSDIYFDQLYTAVARE